LPPTYEPLNTNLSTEIVLVTGNMIEVASEKGTRKDGNWPRQPIYIDDMCLLVISLINNF